MLGPIIGGLIATLGASMTIMISGFCFIAMALFYLIIK